MAPSTRSSAMPRARSRSTMRSRVRCEVMPIPAEVLSVRKPLPCPAQLPGMGKVEAQRRDRDAALLHGVEVGARPGVGGAPGRADPVGGLAARRDEPADRLGL